jgi:hypothetical protein
MTAMIVRMVMMMRDDSDAISKLIPTLTLHVANAVISK